MSTLKEMIMETPLIKNLSTDKTRTRNLKNTQQTLAKYTDGHGAFSKGTKVELIDGDYEGLTGTIIRTYNPTLPLKGTNVFYDVRVNGGYCNKGSGMKGETDFHGNSYYGKIIYAQQETLEKIN